MIKRKNKTRFIKSVVTLGVACGLLFAGVLSLWAATLKIPDLSSFEERKVKQSTKIFDRTGEILLYDVHEDIRRTIVPLDQISEHIKEATVAIEDAQFYTHEGIRLDAILRATLKNISTGDFSQGGSTITQQVIKNSVLTPDKKISRKIKEWVLALKLEKQIPKDKILELYLNETPYGGNIYGVEEASRNFFGKSAKDLSLPEAAYLAALPQAPTYFSPYGNHVDDLERRKNQVLKEMFDNDFISENQYKEAIDAEVEFQPRSPFGIRAPHFVFFVKEYLAEKYGEEMVAEGGLKVITSLDWSLQEKAEEIVTRHALENAKKFNAENAGMVATDPDTGQILVMVGSRGYFDEEIPGAFNIATTHRQPGSAFKPIVYATAFENGYTPETVVFDLQTQFSTACAPSNLSNEDPCYSPTNYDGAFRGPMTLRNALAQSVNIPAVKVLYLTGMDKSLETAKKLGIDSLTNKERYGLTLVLGGGEVSLLDLTGAYGVFANEGKRVERTPILRIETAGGEILEEFDKFKVAPKEVVSRNSALKITDVLSDNVARTPAFGANSYLYFPGIDVASKTGTTNDYRDAWIVGYNPEIAVGAWAGNNDNSPMEKKVAGFIVAPMWNEFMKEALQAVPHTRFAQPEPDNVTKPILRGVWQGGVVRTEPTNPRGGELDDSTPSQGVQSIVTSVHSILHWVEKNDPRGPAPSNPAADPQYRLWEFPVRSWAGGSGYVDNTEIIISDGNENSVEEQIKINIVPEDDNFDADDIIRVRVNVASSHQVDRVEYYINGKPAGQSSRGPSFSANINLRGFELSEANTLSVIAYGEDLAAKGVDQVQFSIK